MPKEILYVKVAFCAPTDVSEELTIAREIVDEWNVNHGENCNLLVKLVNWQSDSRPGLGRAQGIINQDVIDCADIVVGIFWTRFGSPTGVAESGTEEEIRRAIKFKRKLLVYFSTRPTHLAVLAHQISRIEKFKQEFQGEGFYWQYGSLETFKSDLRRHLAKYLNEWPKAQSLNQPKRKSKPSKISQVGNKNFAQNWENVNIGSATFKVPKKSLPKGHPHDSIGADIDMHNYIAYLVKRFNEFRRSAQKQYHERRPYHYSAIHVQIESRFGNATYFNHRSRFGEVVAFLQEKIEETPAGIRNRRLGIDSYHSFNEHKLMSRKA
jgi:hypothetical protein